MSDNQAEQENVYKKYSIRSEHTLLIEASTRKCNSCKYENYCNDKSSLWIEGKLWEFTLEPPSYSAREERLKLRITKKHSSRCDNNNKTAAEIIFWYWNDKKEIVIFHNKVYDDFSNLYEKRPSQIPVNKKFNVVIRLLNKRNEDGNESLLESYYGDFRKVGIDMVTLRICGANGKTEASFVIPKLDLVRASPVFHRMFTAELTEKATGEVKIEDTNAEEFGDFLKAISPKQEHPNPHNVRALLKLADRYNCQLLRDSCETHLMNCIEIPLVERMKCANLYGLMELKENLLTHLEEIGILKWYQENKPQLVLLQELVKLVNE